MKLILASASTRRAEILRDAGLSFTVMSSAVDETPYSGESAHVLVERLAVAKAELVAPRPSPSSSHGTRLVRRLTLCICHFEGEVCPRNPLFMFAVKNSPFAIPGNAWFRLIISPMGNSPPEWADGSVVRLDRQDPYLRLQSVTIFVRDLEQSLRFYLDQLS